MVQDLLPIAAVRFGAICRHRCVITMPMTAFSQNYPVLLICFSNTQQYDFQRVGSFVFVRQLHCLPVRRRVDFKISTLVCRSLAGTAPVYLADECTMVTAAGHRPLRSANIKRAWSRDHATSSVTPILPPPGQRCGTVCLHSFGNRTSPSDNSNDR